MITGKQKSTKCSIANVVKLLIILALAVFSLSVFVTFNLTNSIQTDDSTDREKLLDEPHELMKGKYNEDGGKGEIDETSNENSAVNPSHPVLLKWIKDQKNVAESSPLSSLLSEPVYYLPGSLPLSQLETFQHCYADPTLYSEHLSSGGSTRRVPYSEKHKLALILIPKSGSSTGRFMMNNEFEAVERIKTLDPPLNVITFVREPLSRFMSQYDEAYVRTAPWQKTDNPYYFDPETKKYRTKPHPFPYLFENIHTYRDYEDVFCPPSTRKIPTSRRECIDKKSAENGTLAHRLERFVREYDGRTPFDIHMKFQVPLLSHQDGYPIYLTELHNTTNSVEDWTTIAKRYMGDDHSFKNKDGVIAGRSYPRRFDSKLVSAEAQKRICELALIDYCCLNFPLPDVCNDDGGKNLRCKMDYDEVKKRARVQPSVL